MKTEKQYFNGIFNNRVELGIDQLIDIIVVEQLDNHIPHPMHLAAACKYTIDHIDRPGLFGVEELRLKAYDSEIDEIWLIFDRDPETLFKSQYYKIRKICKTYNLNIGMTNPNFEFWLLLHLPNIHKYNNVDLLKNKKDILTGRRHLERVLDSRLPSGYSKGNIRFHQFKDCIDLALKQSEKFEIDECKILDSLGTTLGKLILRMKED